MLNNRLVEFRRAQREQASQPINHKLSFVETMYKLMNITWKVTKVLLIAFSPIITFLVAIISFLILIHIIS